MLLGVAQEWLNQEYYGIAKAAQNLAIGEWRFVDLEIDWPFGKHDICICGRVHITKN